MIDQLRPPHKVRLRKRIVYSDQSGGCGHQDGALLQARKQIIRFLAVIDQVFRNEPLRVLRTSAVRQRLRCRTRTPEYRRNRHSNASW